MPFNWIVWVLIYAAAVSTYGFVLMGRDKKKAAEHKWRIPEKRLFLTAAIGGSIGVFLGMLIFRHKTKHVSFVIGIPLIITIQCLVILVFALKGF